MKHDSANLFIQIIIFFFIAGVIPGMKPLLEIQSDKVLLL